MDDSFFAALGATLIVYVIIAIALGVLAIIAWWKIFVKAGERGWKIFIPIYDTYIQFKIAWSGLGFWIFLALAVLYGIFSAIGGDGTSFANILAVVLAIGMGVLDIILQVKTAKAFGKGVGFAIGLIFLPTIFTMILAFGSAQYVGANGIPEHNLG